MQKRTSGRTDAPEGANAGVPDVNWRKGYDRRGSEVLEDKDETVFRPAAEHLRCHAYPAVQTHRQAVGSVQRICFLYNITIVRVGKSKRGVQRG